MIKYQIKGWLSLLRLQRLTPTYRKVVKQLVSRNQAEVLEALSMARRMGWLSPDSAYFQNVDLAHADLTGGDLSQANLWKANFVEAVLVDAQFREALLAVVNLQGANLTRANFESAHLDCANLRQANLTGAILHKAMCIEAYFSHAKLTGTDFTNAQFNGATFEGCDLTQANLLNAGFACTDLRGAKISQTQLATLYTLRGATMPDGERYDGRYRLKGDIDLCLKLEININDGQEIARWYGIGLEDYLAGQQWADKHLTQP